MLIEFTGSACSGKTLVIESVIIRLKDLGIESKLAETSFLKGFIYSLKTLKFSITLFSKSNARLKHLNIPFFNKLNFYRNLIKKIGDRIQYRNSKDIILIDEGLMHLAQNFVDGDLDNGMRQNDITEFYDSIPSPNLLVVIDSPRQDLMNRLNKRGHRRFKDSSKMHFYVDQGKVYLQMLNNYLKENDLSFVKYDNIELEKIQDISSSIVEEILKKHAPSD